MDKLVARRIIADKYRLERALAAGGMGSVWSAWNTQLDVPVAIKFMAPAMASSHELVARFEREARAAAQIRSSHVVQIFEHGVDDGLPFIVMELLEGEDLGQRMRRVGRLPLADTARIVSAVCKALRRAHAIGIVHRDLKPANVFLARGDEDDEELVKVLDFGVVKSLAEAVDSGVTKTGELIGTPNYMSPEQARSTKTVDHRSDLWSLGIIAYRALTATLPFPDEEGIERLMRICSEPVPPPSAYAADIEPEVDAFFKKALAMDPEDRFQTAREMAEALANVAGVPLSSRSGSRSCLPSQLDLPPLSNSVYTAHAYVYTSAADAENEGEGPRAQGRRRPSGSSLSRDSGGPPSSRAALQLAAARASLSPSPGARDARQSFPRAASPSPVPEAPSDQATCVSGVDPAHQIIVAPTPRRQRAPVVQVVSTSADCTPPSMSPLGVAHEIGMRSTGSPVAMSLAPGGTSRWRIATFAFAAAVVLGAAGLALTRRAEPPGPQASSTSGSATLAAAAVLASPAQTATAATPPPAPDPDPAPASPSATALASAAPSATATAPKLFGPKPKPPPSSRKEGGLGRRPTY